MFVRPGTAEALFLPRRSDQAENGKFFENLLIKRKHFTSSRTTKCYSDGVCG